MTLTDWIAPVCAVVSAGSALVTAWRANIWRKSDQTGQLQEKINSLETTAARQATDLAALKAAQAALPTKADIATLTGEVKLASQLANTAVKGIDRVEGMLIKEGLSR